MTFFVLHKVVRTDCNAKHYYVRERRGPKSPPRSRAVARANLREFNASEKHIISSWRIGNDPMGLPTKTKAKLLSLNRICDSVCKISFHIKDSVLECNRVKYKALLRALYSALDYVENKGKWSYRRIPLKRFLRNRIWFALSANRATSALGYYDRWSFRPFATVVLDNP